MDQYFSKIFEIYDLWIHVSKGHKILKNVCLTEKHIQRANIFQCKNTDAWKYELVIRFSVGRKRGAGER